MCEHLQKRRDKLRSRLRKLGLPALLVTNFKNVTYLTGFTGDDSYLLVTPEDTILLSDFRYVEQIEQECPELSLEVRPLGVTISQLVARVIKGAGIGKCGIEGDSVTVSMAETLSSGVPDVEFVTTRGEVEQLRRIKDKHELAAIRRAVSYAERAFAVARALMSANQTERQIADQLDHDIRRCGGVGCSFVPIVAVGDRAALPHAPPSERQIGEDEFVLIDWGANEGLYMSDLTRVVVTGKISPKLERIYRVVLNAQRQAIAAIKPGVLMKDVDQAARSVIAEAGYAKNFGHGLGHGIGLEIHESPRLAGTSEEPLRAGMIVTVEPGIYLPGWGGVRIEDDVLVTRDGHEVLSAVPKEFEDCALP
ncbi:MAG: aminopeptidase P family protein [Planctomycetales bacterium]|nr:aminopeptidase P family protein [Planctomycetales bacterium]